ncbi:MAG: ABC transporter permease [Terracidiphilus sp.]
MLRNLRALWMRLARARKDEIDAEIESHVATHTEDGVRAGFEEEEARRQALVRLGGAEQTRQAWRERNTLPWVEIVLRDVRYALRGFGRNPIFAITVIVTLALGIGATTAVFSVVDRILFRSLPYAHADRLVSVGLTAPIIPEEFMLGGSYYNWQDHQQPFTALTSEMGVNACDLTEHNPAHLSCASVEGNFLPTLGVSPVLGRNFLPEEDRPNGPKVALISDGLWLSHYHRDPGILNQVIDLDTRPVRVIGVLPRDFEMPRLQKIDVLVPEALDKAAERKADPGHVLYAFARLKSGITPNQASEQLKPVFDYSLSQAPPRFRSEVHLRVRSLRDRQMQDVRLVAWVLLGAAFAVLLIACANVASLLLTRAVARERELAVRSALGATRRRLVLQALTESILLALLGAAAGCGLADGLLRIFIGAAPASLPLLAKAQLDFRILVFTAVLALVCGLVFGLGAALHRPRALALAARTAGTSGRAWLRRCMVVSQIAISMVLLAGAALLVRSFTHLQTQNLGVGTRGVVTAAISLNRYRYATPQAQMQFFLRAEAASRRLPGVSAVSVSDSAPPGGLHHDQIFSNIAVAGRPAPTGETGGMVAWRWVTPDYFGALGIPIVRGRNFAEDQRTAKEQFLILSSLLASRLFPNQDPIGQRVQPVPNGPWYTVEGVAANVKNSGLTSEDEPEFYQLRRALPDDWNSAPSVVLIVKTNLAPKAVESWVRSEIAQIDPTVPVDMETLHERVNELSDRPRFETMLLGFFAACGLLMAVIGLYGVIAFMALQRTQEIGVRMALGASRTDILRLIAGEGARLIVLGGVLGLAAAIGATQLLKSLLFQVGPHDPISFVAVAVLLALVALAATFVPARAAMKTDPMVALRCE